MKTMRLFCVKKRILIRSNMWRHCICRTKCRIRRWCYIAAINISIMVLYKYEYEYEECQVVSDALFLFEGGDAGQREIFLVQLQCDTENRRKEREV